MDNFKYDVKGGIKRDRGCTDCFCLIIFLAYIAGMVYCSIYGMKHGDLHKLTAPIDANHNFCGSITTTTAANGTTTTTDLQGFKYLYFPNAFSTTTNPTDGAYCVEKCPAKGETVTCKTPSPCANEVATKDNKNKLNLKFCIPDGWSKKPWDALKSAAGADIIEDVVDDVSKAYRSIIICAVMSIVLNLVFIYLMAYFAEPLSWIIIVLFQLGLIGSTVLCFFMRKWSAEGLDSQKETLRASTPTDAEYEKMAKQLEEDQKKSAKWYLAGMIILGVCALAFMCCLVCARGHLGRAIDCIDASADFLRDNKRVMLVPNLHFIFAAIAFFVWCLGFAAVVSLNEINADTQLYQFRDMEWTKTTKWLAVGMLFGMFWVTSFFDYCGRMVVYVAAATYYFNSGPGRPDGEGEVAFGF